MNEALKHKAYALLVPPLRALAEQQNAIIGLSYHRFESAPRAESERCFARMARRSSSGTSPGRGPS